MQKSLWLVITALLFMSLGTFADANPKKVHRSKVAVKKALDPGLELTLKETKNPSKGVHRFVCSLKNKTRKREILALTMTHLPLVSFLISSSEPKGKKEISGDVNPPFNTAGEVSPTLWVTVSIKPKKQQEVATLDIDTKALTAASSFHSWKLGSFKKRTVFITANYKVSDSIVESFKKTNGKSVPAAILKSGELKIRLK